MRTTNRLLRTGSFACLTGMLLLQFAGCAWLRNAFHPGYAPPQIFSQQVSREQIIQAVNANSQAIRSLHATVHVRATGTPTLSGDLSLEQPNRLRMQVGLLNMNSTGLDIGSNDQEFWVWLKSAFPGGPPPAVLYARHDEYERSAARNQIPIEPSWVIDSLGLAYFDPRAQHQGPFQRPDGGLEMRSTYQSGNDTMVKTTVVDPRTSVVIAQELYRNGTKIAASQASDHQYFPEIKASIPRRVELEIGLNTPQPGQVTIELSNILPNSVDANFAGLWEMPRPQNIQMIDIARQAPQYSENPGPAMNPGTYRPADPRPAPGSENGYNGANGSIVNQPGSIRQSGQSTRHPDSGRQYPGQQPVQRATWDQSEFQKDYAPRGFPTK